MTVIVSKRKTSINQSQLHNLVNRDIELIHPRYLNQRVLSFKSAARNKNADKTKNADLLKKIIGEKIVNITEVNIRRKKIGGDMLRLRNMTNIQICDENPDYAEITTSSEAAKSKIEDEKISNVTIASSDPGSFIIKLPLSKIKTLKF